MDTEPKADKPAFQSLSDYIVKYDMARLAAEARSEFETVVTSRELVSQDLISEMFNDN